MFNNWRHHRKSETIAMQQHFITRRLGVIHVPIQSIFPTGLLISHKNLRLLYKYDDDRPPSLVLLFHNHHKWTVTMHLKIPFVSFHYGYMWCNVCDFCIDVPDGIWECLPPPRNLTRWCPWRSSPGTVHCVVCDHLSLLDYKLPGAEILFYGPSLENGQHIVHP